MLSYLRKEAGNESSHHVPFTRNQLHQGTDDSRHSYRWYNHRRLHGGERLSGAQGGDHLRHLHPGCGHLHGNPTAFRRSHGPGEQHRSDDRFGSRHSVVDYFRPAGTHHHRLVVGFSLLDDGLHHHSWRHPRGHLLHSAATGPGHPFRSAVSRGSGGGRGASRRRHHRGGRGVPAGIQDDSAGLAGLRGACPSCRLSRSSGWRSPASSRSARAPPYSARRCPWPSSVWGIWSASPSVLP